MLSQYVVEAYRLDEYDNRKTKASPDGNGCPSGDALLYRVTSKKLKAHSLYCFYKSKIICSDSLVCIG